jgi:hypothetical protein
LPYSFSPATTATLPAPLTTAADATGVKAVLKPVAKTTAASAPKPRTALVVNIVLRSPYGKSPVLLAPSGPTSYEPEGTPRFRMSGSVSNKRTRYLE